MARELIIQKLEVLKCQIEKVNQENHIRDLNNIPIKKTCIIFDMRDLGIVVV